MFTGRTQHLDIQSPSPTTVSFTVSTATRKPSRFLDLFRHGFRALLVAFALLVTITKIQQSLVLSTDFFRRHGGLVVSSLSRSLPGGDALNGMSESLDWWVILPLSLGVVYLSLRRDHVGKPTTNITGSVVMAC
jgi:hypothetical protein